MGADFHIRGDTKLDSSGFSKGIDKLGSVAKKGAATMQSSFQGAISVLDKVKSKFSSASSEADKFQKKTKETDPYLGKLKSTLKETEKELDELTKAYRKAVVEKGRYSKEAQELGNKIKEAERKQTELRSEIEKSSDAFEDAAKDAKKYGSTLSDLKGKSSGLGGLIKTGLGGLGNAAKVGFSTLVTAGAAAVGALGAAGGASVKLASDLTEVQNVVDVTFGKNKNADTINAWAKNAASAFGLSELQAKKFNGTMGAMLKSMGLSDDAVLDMSTSMTGRAGDFASFYNLPIEEAFQKIRSGISGETEPLKELGINMSVANLEAYALSQGIDKSYDSMTQAEQATLRYNYLMSASADAQGDFARTNDNLANQLRIAQLEVQNLGGAIGMSLLPMAQEMLGVGIDMLGQLKQGFEQGGVEGLISAATNVVGQLLNGFVNSAPSLIDAGVQILMMVLNGIATLIPTLPQQSQSIITALANGIFTLLPTLLIVGGQLILSLLQGLSQALPNILNSGSQTLQSFISGALSGFSELANLALNILLTLVQALISSLPTLIPAALQMVFVLIDTLMNNLDKIIQTGIQLLVSLAKGFADTYPQLIAKIPILIGQLIGKLISYLPEILAAGIEIVLTLLAGIVQAFPDLIFQIPTLLKQIWDEIINYDWLAAGDRVIKSLQDGIEAAWDGLVGWFNGIWDGLFGNRTANVTVNTHENRTVSTSYQSSGGAGRRSVNGSHRSGLEYVPFDGYIAELHKGETVLTSQQAGLWRSGAVQRMLSAASSVMMANQSRSPVLATAGAPAVSRQTAATVQTQHTTVIEMDGRTVAKVITPFVDQFLF